MGVILRLKTVKLSFFTVYPQPATEKRVEPKITSMINYQHHIFHLLQKSPKNQIPTTVSYEKRVNPATPSGWMRSPYVSAAAWYMSPFPPMQTSRSPFSTDTLVSQRVRQMHCTLMHGGSVGEADRRMWKNGDTPVVSSVTILVLFGGRIWLWCVVCDWVWKSQSHSHRSFTLSNTLAKTGNHSQKYTPTQTPVCYVVMSQHNCNNCHSKTPKNITKSLKFLSDPV